MDSDGFYYRNTHNGQGLGPLSHDEIEYLRRTGEITDNTRVWRQQGGNIYKLDIKRKYMNICSFEACNHACELIMITVTFLCTGFAMTLGRTRITLSGQRLRFRLILILIFGTKCFNTVYLAAGTTDQVLLARGGRGGGVRPYDKEE